MMASSLFSGFHVPMANIVQEKGRGSPVWKQALSICAETRHQDSRLLLLFCNSFSSKLMPSIPLLELKSQLFVTTIISHGLPPKGDFN